jgi:hypothetical protein
VIHAVIAGCHRLNALAVARADQPGHIGRAHPPAPARPTRIQERFKPARKLVGPIQSRARHGQPRKCRPPMNPSKADSGIPKISELSKISQSSARVRNRVTMSERAGTGNPQAAFNRRRHGQAPGASRPGSACRRSR